MEIVIYAMDLKEEEKKELLDVWNKIKTSSQAMDDILVTFMKNHPDIFDKFCDLCDKPSDVMVKDDMFKAIKSKMKGLLSKLFKAMDDDKLLQDLALKLATFHSKFDIDGDYLQKAPEELTETVKDSLPEGLSPVAKEALFKILQEFSCCIERNMN
ncbi:uncharacterized protein [Anabrus simplex]|uniref:uncharacterized protein n=1 Tax=Anabrus simplex TaxID=316456 RepID=UPI0035A266E5